MSKAIVSIGAGPQRKLLALARRSIEPYARRHGYDLELRTEVPADLGRPAPWAKVRLLRELSERYDTLVWLDADLVIVDPRRDIAQDADGSLLALAQHSDASREMPNSGVMVLRGDDDGRRFLDEVWAQEDLVDHRWWENAAICRLLGYDLDPPRPSRETEWLARTTFLDPRWNSIHDNPSPRPYIRHYPGYSLKTRMAFMLRDLAVRRR